MTNHPLTGPISALAGAPAARLGESPLWHPQEQVLYWVDIAARRLHRHDPADASHHAWPLPQEPGCCAPLFGGGVLLAMRDGLWQFDTRSGERLPVAAAPYDAALMRFNDGKADAHGRFWASTYDDARQPRGALFRHSRAGTEPVFDGVATGNGLAFSPDNRTLYWADTAEHTVYAFDFDLATGWPSKRRVLARFARRVNGQPLSAYGGRPDGAAVDAQGAYWIAMYEGQRLLRLAADGSLLAEVPLPVRCPTMPCFGGADLRTLYVTTARERRPADELAAQPLAGQVLCMRVAVAGLPAQSVRLS